MIGKITTGKGFRGCIQYNLEGKNGEKIGKVDVLEYNKCYGDKNELVKQFSDVRDLNTRIEKPVLHISLSFPESDNPTRKDLIDIANDCAKKFEFHDKQYIVIQHFDKKDSTHFHIVANRVGFDGKAIQTSHNYRKMAEFCRAAESKYNLTPVLSPRRFLKGKERNLPRLDNRKELLKENINVSIGKSKSMNEFKRLMEEKGYTLKLGRGITFIDPKKVLIKGSAVGFSLSVITKLIGKGLESAINQNIQKNIKQNL